MGEGRDGADVCGALDQLLWATSDFSCRGQFLTPKYCLGLCFGGNPSKTREEGNFRLRTRYGGVESVRGILGSSGRGLEFFPQPKDPI